MIQEDLIALISRPTLGYLFIYEKDQYHKLCRENIFNELGKQNKKMTITWYILHVDVLIEKPTSSSLEFLEALFLFPARCWNAYFTQC